MNHLQTMGEGDENEWIITIGQSPRPYPKRYWVRLWRGWNFYNAAPWTSWRRLNLLPLHPMKVRLYWFLSQRETEPLSTMAEESHRPITDLYCGTGKRRRCLHSVSMYRWFQRQTHCESAADLPNRILTGLLPALCEDHKLIVMVPDQNKPQTQWRSGKVSSETQVVLDLLMSQEDFHKAESIKSRKEAMCCWLHGLYQ